MEKKGFGHKLFLGTAFFTEETSVDPVPSLTIVLVVLQQGEGALEGWNLERSALNRKTLLIVVKIEIH